MTARIYRLRPSRDAYLGRAFALLVRIGREQGMESMLIPCDLARLAMLIERDARVRRMVSEHVERRCHEAVRAGMERAV